MHGASWLYERDAVPRIEPGLQKQFSCGWGMGVRGATIRNIWCGWHVTGGNEGSANLSLTKVVVHQSSFAPRKPLHQSREHQREMTHVWQLEVPGFEDVPKRASLGHLVQRLFHNPD